MYDYVQHNKSYIYTVCVHKNQSHTYDVTYSFTPLLMTSMLFIGINKYTATVLFMYTKGIVS